MDSLVAICRNCNTRKLCVSTDGANWWGSHHAITYRHTVEVWDADERTAWEQELE